MTLTVDALNFFFRCVWQFPLAVEHLRAGVPVLQHIEFTVVFVAFQIDGDVGGHSCAANLQDAPVVADSVPSHMIVARPGRSGIARPG